MLDTVLSICMQKDKRAIPFLLIFVVWMVVVATNYKNIPILGWDSLATNLNIKLGFSRATSGAWLEYFGLGTPSGLPIVTDLSRLVLLWPASFFVSSYMLRNLWVFAMLLLGPLGVYLLLSEIFGKEKRSSIAALTGSFFYLFNFATIQYFHAPFEAFVTFYAFLPFGLLFPLCFCKGKSRSLLKLLLSLILFSTAFYVQTLFVVYLLVLIAFFVPFLTRKDKFLKFIKLVLFILAVNLYWLLPVGYYTLTSSSFITDSKSNQLSTYETRLMNQARGGMDDIVFLRGFWVDYTDFNGKEFAYLMETWRMWTESASYRISMTTILLTSLLGLLACFLSGKRRISLAVIVLGASSAIMLSAGRGIIGQIFYYFADTLPLFEQIFRSPFTKWSLILPLSFAMGIGLLLVHLGKRTSIVVATLLIALSLYQVKPVFEGKLIYDKVYQNIPDQYEKLFEFFSHEPKQTRIAKFPVQTFWGWDFYDWGYRGSGFLWYGIEQPILDRAFDVWSRENEGFYFEMNRAVYQNDPVLFEQVIAKYQISYALVDESVIVIGGDQSQLNYQGIHTLLQEAGAKNVFAEGKLKVYKFDTPQKFVQAPSGYSLAKSVGESTREDPIYLQNGDYVASDNVIYPFWGLNREGVKNVNYENGFDGEKVVLSQELENLSEYALWIPPLSESEPVYLSGEVFLQGRDLTLNFQKFVDFEGAPALEPITITLARNYSELIVVLGQTMVRVSEGQKESFANARFSLTSGMEVQLFDAGSTRSIDLTAGFSSASFKTCWEREGGSPEFQVVETPLGIRAQIKDAVACNSTKVGDLGPLKHFVQISLPYRSADGARPHFCLVNEGESECLHEDVFYHTKPSADWGVISREAVLPGSKAYWLVLSARPPEEKGESWEIEYQRPEVLVYPLLSEVVIEPSLLVEYFKPLSLNVSDTKALKLSFPANKNVLDFAGSGNERNCDVFERGSAFKAIKDSKVVYQASGRGAVCDYLLSGMDSGSEYLIRFQGKHLKGRSLKAYLYDPGSGKNDLEVLMDGQEFDNTFSVLSWPWEEEYVLNLEGRSFGQETSEIVLDLVNFYHFPVSWVSRFRLIKSESGIMANDIEVKNHDKLGNYLYSVDIDAKNQGLISFSQAHDPGWVAWGDGHVLKHHAFNSWANAWEVPGGSYTVYIFYWPQILEYIGFICLLFIPIALALDRN